MAFSFIESTTSAAVADGGSVTIPSTTLGHLIVVAIAGNATGRTITSITDNQGNTYAVDIEASNTNATAHLASTRDAFGGVTSVTVDMSGSGTYHVDVIVFSGVKTSSFRGLNSSLTGTGTALSVTSFTPTADSLIVAVGGTGGNRTFSAGTNYTAASEDVGSSVRGMSEYRLSAPGTGETAPISIAGGSSTWSEVAQEYFPEPSGASLVPKNRSIRNALVVR